MSVRGIRGATTSAANTAQAIVAATDRLLREMIASNGIEPIDLAAVFFTTTPDLNTEFPAAAARALGWQQVPLLCATEIGVPERLGSCIRVLMLVNTDLPQADYAPRLSRRRGPAASGSLRRGDLAGTRNDVLTFSRERT